MTDAPDPDRDRAPRAAELALGLLDGEDAASARRELLRDPAFRASYEYWSATAGEWLEAVPPEEPGGDLWPAIEAATRVEEPVAARPTGNGPVFVWAVAATLAAVFLGIAALLFYQREAVALQDNASLARRVAEADGARQIAQITGDSAQVLVSALYDPESGRIDVRLDLPTEPRKVPELWVIPGDGKPRSLGTFKSTDARIDIDPVLRPYLIDGATLAVTMEPEQDAPHAAPTGPVLGTTELRQI